ncbi:hypothetical protein [Rhodoligotrophos defluvii]|uniref:hypothetical protein n=1 Tax=Rhodoligotrophos defluvii TaxID=2561934 RepID=UPI0010C9998B|nr:hypothetical protein [Rhodoligotrophos defluvii]
MPLYERLNDFMAKYENFIKIPVIYGGTATLIGVTLYNTVHAAKAEQAAAQLEPHHDVPGDHAQGDDQVVWAFHQGTWTGHMS